MKNETQSLWIRLVLTLGWARTGHGIETGTVPDCADRSGLPERDHTGSPLQHLSHDGSGAPPPEVPEARSEEEDFWLVVMKYSVCC